MKHSLTFCKLFLAICAMLACSLNVQACHLSYLQLNSVTDLGSDQWQIDMTLCVGSGTDGQSNGGQGNTGDFIFILGNGASFVTYPTTLTGPETGNVFNAYPWSSDSLIYYNQSQWYACVGGGCGPLQSVCNNVTFVTQGLPDSLFVQAIEGDGIIPYGCFEADQGVNPLAGYCDIDPAAVITDAGCTTNNGAIDLTPTGANGPYSYKWNNGATTEDLSALAPGTYTVTITDNGFCTDVESFDVQQGSSMTVDLGAAQTAYIGWAPAECVDITAAITGGTAPFTYAWSTGATTATINECPSASTSYTVQVTDALGCVANGAVFVAVQDVRCGNNNNKVLLCHNGTTRCVRQNSVQQHLNHGDQLGACTNKDGEGMIFEEVALENTLTAAPNPFNTSTTMTFSVAEHGDVTIDIYNMAGAKVASVFNGHVEEGIKMQVEFNAETLPGGVYYSRMIGEHGTFVTQKLVLVK